MLPRFYAPALGDHDRGVDLPPDEARHLTRVLRLGAGDAVAVFDGRGREFRARVDVAVRDTVRVSLVEPLVPAGEPRVPLTLVQAVLKGDAMDAAVRDAVMMGAARIVPVISAHVTVPARALESGRAAERWRRVALASVKQCRRATLPHVEEPAAFAGHIAEPRAALRLMLLEPSAGAVGRTLHEWLDRPAPASVELLVGPEGGWASAEVGAAIAAGWLPVTLGPLTLRADAVALAALSVARFVWNGGDS